VTEPVRKSCRPAGYAMRVITVLVFGFKALIPAGYMYAAVDGHARLVMCLAGLAGAANTHHMSGMAHGTAMNHAGHAALPADQCPFALAGGAGLLASNHNPLVPYFTILSAALAPAFLVVPATPPSRYHAPRGPPSPA
jgi:hypothetical protein